MRIWKIQRRLYAQENKDSSIRLENGKKIAKKANKYVNFVVLLIEDRNSNFKPVTHFLFLSFENTAFIIYDFKCMYNTILSHIRRKTTTTGLPNGDTSVL